MQAHGLLHNIIHTSQFLLVARESNLTVNQELS